jgi:hypothetical protein
MKIILILISTIAILYSDPSYEVPYARIESAFNTNDAKTIISFGKERILLKILDKEGGYSQTQAALILQDFFTKKSNGHFTYTYKGIESEEGVFCMGFYTVKNEKYKVSFHFKKIKSTYQFESLNIILEKK